MDHLRTGSAVDQTGLRFSRSRTRLHSADGLLAPLLIELTVAKATEVDAAPSLAFFTASLAPPTHDVGASPSLRPESDSVSALGL